MAGYVSQNGQNVFGATLRALRDTVTSFKNPLDVVVRDVDTSVKGPDPDGALALQKASINPKIYGGGETDLAGAIGEFAASPARQKIVPVGDGEAAPEDAPPPARIHVLITDGVQSKKSQSGKCLKGSDPTCVREKIINLLKAGWGAYIIGLRSQFHGTIYSEVNPAARIQYDSIDGRPQTFRPFYLYVFSPDRAALDEFVGAVRERLRAVAPPDTLRVLALTSPYSEPVGKAEAVIPKESEDAIELGEQEESPARLTLGVNPNTTDTSPVPLTVAIEVPWSKSVLDSGSKQELASVLAWDVTQVYPSGGAAEGGKRYPVVKVKSASGVAPDARGLLPVQLSVGWPRSTEAPAWGVYRLRGRLDFGEGKDPLPWIRQWSTDLDTTKEQGARTLNLESILTSLLRNPVLEQQPVAEVYLRVGPQ
jgi:hypothetical protein